MINKVVYINYQSITDKYCTDYYLNECIDNGLIVEYWDVSKLYFPNNPNNHYDLNDVNKFNSVQIYSLRELKNKLLLTTINSTFFITNITYEFRVWKLFRLLTVFNCKLGFFARGMFPMPERNISSKISRTILSFNFKKIIGAFKNIIAKQLKKNNYIKTFDVIFRAGSEGGRTIGIGSEYDLKTGHIVEINFFDYDKYLLVLNTPVSSSDDYCVFLDVYLPHHPDIAILGIETVNSDIYYSQLNNYFDYIEKTYNLKVVICAHPKAHKYKTENPFCGRKIVFNQTCEFVKDSKFAITNYSTSISFPILFKKPIFFITCEAEKKIMYDLYETTLYLSKVLNCTVSQFDLVNSTKSNELYVDKELYNDYLYKYLTSKESKNRMSSEIFIEIILKL
ncbi:hypothetical protein [Flavobacterium seoulense]|uniref:Uncharacterized protein n=1 Tax=Flavobacterium seoulense TaxID=1492738 RepID=A0A066WNA4_9FLAO|nr:hypothetical protein [Flavobacterium seoulense]KDN55316.1 hypothetical protein FEM21_14430 [Flavobacterium seoulense]